MTIWNNVHQEGAAAALERLLGVLERSAELNAAIASAQMDKRVGASGPDIKARAKKAKAARQTLQNPIDGTASLSQTEDSLVKAANRILKDHGKQLAAMAPVLVELWITKSQLEDVRQEREKVKASKCGADVRVHERAFLNAIYAAGSTQRDLRQLAGPDIAYIAAFMREKTQDPHHRRADGLAMAAFRGGNLDLAVKGLNADEQFAVLLASDNISEQDLKAKRMFEEAAGRPLDLSATLAGALARASEVYRAGNFWPGSLHTIDHSMEDQFGRDLQAVMRTLDGDEGRAWNILLPPVTYQERATLPESDEEEIDPACVETARQMLDHVHGEETDRWEWVMGGMIPDVASRLALIDRVKPHSRNDPRVREGWEEVVMASDWRAALMRCQDHDVNELAILVSKNSNVRWLAKMREIAVPEHLEAEPPLLVAARLLQQPLTEIVWELFAPPPQGPIPPAAPEPSDPIYPQSSSGRADADADEENY